MSVSDEELYNNLRWLMDGYHSYDVHESYNWQQALPEVSKRFPELAHAQAAARLGDATFKRLLGSVVNDLDY